MKTTTKHGKALAKKLAIVKSDTTKLERLQTYLEDVEKYLEACEFDKLSEISVFALVERCRCIVEDTRATLAQPYKYEELIQDYKDSFDSLVVQLLWAFTKKHARKQ